MARSNQAKAAPNKHRHRRIIGITAGVIAAVTLIGASVLATGYDERELPRVDTSVWVARESGRYARVNTTLGEIDTIRSVQSPSLIVQSGTNTVVFGQGNGSLWPIDPANPANLVGESSEQEANGSNAPETAPIPTPAGTRSVSIGGDWMLLLTDVGQVYLASIAAVATKSVDFARVDPYAAGAGPPDSGPGFYAADAVTVSQAGTVFMYSVAEGAIRRFDARLGVFIGGAVAVPDAPTAGATLQLTAIGNDWAMLQPGTGKFWMAGASSAVDLQLAPGALLQAAGPKAETVAIADQAGLLLVSRDGKPTERLAATGQPARPVSVAGTLVAAWLEVGSGTMWTSRTGMNRLETESDILADLDEINPLIRSNGDRAVLNETGSGMLWTIPDGTLIPVSSWSNDREDTSEEGSVTVDDAAEQEPPVAVSDEFGVRVGSTAILPLLYNDYDPNRSDILTISADPEMVTNDSGFGRISLVGGDQSAVIEVRAASGSSAFEYRVTDGIGFSKNTTVTLNVIPDDVNTAPVWCGVNECTQTWPNPEIAPGGSLSVRALDGWVDPEGDPFVLADVEVLEGKSIVAIPTDDGRVAISHTDPNGLSGEATLRITVMDDRGATASRELNVRISAVPTLTIRPTAVVGIAGEPTRVKLSDVVVGGSGVYRITDATEEARGTESVSVIPNAAEGAIEMRAADPGEYLISFTVVDSITDAERSGVLRFSVRRPNNEIAIPPLTAFVRSGEDATVDVLAAISNTTGRVVAVSTATSDNPALSAAVVGQSTVRVRAANPDVRPGPIGTVAIALTDGAGGEATGSLSVFVAASEPRTAPSAVPDSVPGRAGAPWDIAVLANDFSTRGELLQVHQDVVGSGAEGELAFTAGRTLRYLAPPNPGVYTIGYSIFAESSPELVASSTVTITVLGTGANRPPQPHILTARAVVGTAVDIGVEGFGLDPDGDEVTLTAVGQPPAGSGFAAIGAKGTTITYQAPGASVPDGQVSFDYTVRDSFGAVATGTVRVAVIDRDVADLTPVTYSNHVRLQVGSKAATLVQPLQDDRDPAGGQLELISLVPFSPGGPGTVEFERLRALVADGTDLASGEVSLLAGDITGTHGYIYTVRSTATTSTAEGLIVVTVGRETMRDIPQVDDTVLTLADRTALATGLDVVAGKVRWSAGDPSGLELRVWGAAADRWIAEGTRIRGPVPAMGALVPFELRGTDASGEPVATYGFLRIPALDDMRIQPAPTQKPVRVAEEASVLLDARSAVSLAPGDVLETPIDASFLVQRSEATCVSVGGKITYQAGREAPWVDSCAVPMRVAGQDTWTVVAIPITIIPKEPRAILQSIGRTIAPGATDVIDLYRDLTTWESGRVGDRNLLDYRVSYSGSAFVIGKDGDRLTIQASAAAIPGTRETVRINVTGFGGLTAAITLTVGTAAVDAPRGATVSRTCTVTEPSCLIAVTGVAGEYDPFAGKPGSGLRVIAVGSAGAPGAGCDVATVRVASDSTLQATWPSAATPPGGTCRVSFTVVDAQARRGLGELILDVRGFPAAPASVSTVEYTATTVTLEVALGPARQAQPPITTVTILENGSPVGADCQAVGAGAYRCTVTGLGNGEPHTYTARAVNPVGESLDTTAHTTWAYRPPVVSAVTASTRFVPGRTTIANGVVELEISADADALSFSIAGTGVSIPRTGATSTGTVDLPAGSVANIQVIPVSKFAPPIGTGNEGASVGTSILVAGTAFFPTGGSVSTAPDGTSATLDFPPLSANGSPLPLSTLYAASQSVSMLCEMDASGAATVSGGTGLLTSASPVLTGLIANTDYYFLACGANGYGASATATIGEFTFVDPSSPTGIEYLIDPSPTGAGADWAWSQVTASGIAPPPGVFIRFDVDGVQHSSLDGSAFTPGLIPTITAEYCRNTAAGPRCGAPAPVVAAVGSAQATMTVAFPTACIADGTVPAVVVSGPSSAFDVVVTSTPNPGSATIEHQYAFTWLNSFAMLDPPADWVLTCPLPGP